jgi:hypothetical protein
MRVTKTYHYSGNSFVFILSTETTFSLAADMKTDCPYCLHKYYAMAVFMHRVFAVNKLFQWPYSQIKYLRD